MLNKCISFAILKRSVPLSGSFSGRIGPNLHKNSWIGTQLGSIYRNYLEEDHNLVALLSDDLMILYYFAHYFFPVVCSTRWCTVAPTSHCLGRCEYSTPNTDPNFHAHTVWEYFHFSVGLWPGWLLTAAPTRFSTKNVKRWNKWDVSFRKKCFGLLCMHTLQRNTQCSYNLTHAEQPGCCQNLFNPFPRCITDCR